MSDPVVFWYEQKELKDPIAIIGFPSIGLVGSIMTSFMARELKLPVVAGITFPDVQQYTLIQEGNAYPPIRIHAGAVPKARRKKKAKPAEGEETETPAEEVVKPAPKKRVKARDLIIISSELAPKPEQTYEFTQTLLNIVKEMGATQIIFLDGIPRMEQNTTVIGAYSNQEMRDLLKEAEVNTMDDGLIRGMSGVGIFQGKMDGTNTICLISPAHPQIPDPRAASELVEPLQRIVPRLHLDPEPLVLEAEEIESRIRAQAQQQMVNQNLYG
ncbi:MAG: PAC2 family protein [archaeon]|nr:PAC2 family protein [archaeon]